MRMSMLNKLHKLANEHTGFRNFRELIDAKGGYVPTIPTTETWGKTLADAYDIAMFARGDDRRAYRRNVK